MGTVLGVIAIFIVFLLIFGPFIIMMLRMSLDDVDIGKKLSEWRGKRKYRKNRNKPIYERLALAYEWKAEQLLADGRIDRARDELRSAERVRREAMYAMMNGEEPRI